MVTKPLSNEVLQETVEVYQRHGAKAPAARELNISDHTLRNRLKRAAERSILPAGFEVEPLPDELPTAEELLERRKKDFARKRDAEEARRLIPVKINIDGPIGIVHMGDPHVDDDGCDLDLMERHVNAIRNTEGLFGANLGDITNNWIGRLARLYGEQSTSAAEAWVLAEWLVTSINWLYLVGGNHDCWSGAGDPLKWMLRSQAGVYENWGARLNLTFPNGKTVRVNARHDFTGHSMWNVTHGPAKAVQMGWRDHILTCGHKHISGYQVLKCPASGLVSHAIRCAGYKIYDRYAKEKGLPDQNIFAAAVTIIDPQYEDSDPKLITTLFDVEEAAEYLKFKRR